MSITVERLVAEIEADPEAAIRQLGRLGLAIDKAARDRTAHIDVDTSGAQRGVKDLTRELDKNSSSASRNKAEIKNLSITSMVTSRAVQGLGLAVSSVQFGALFAGASLLAPALQAVTGAAGGLVATLTPLTGLLGALGPLSVAAGGGIGALLLGVGGVTKAVQAYTKVQTASSAAVKNSGEAARRVASAERGVAEARRGVVVATKAVKEAEAGIAQARKDAAEALVNQREDAVLAGYAQTEAVLALEDAQERLRKAQQRTAQQGKTLMKQTDDFTGKVYEVSFQSSDQSEAPDIAGAQRDVVRAQIEVERAKRRNKNTQDDLNTAEKKGIENSDYVVEAKNRYARALDDLARSQQNVTDAQRRMADATARLSEKMAGGSAATKAYDAAMAKLTPQGRAFVTFLTGTFIPALKGFKSAAEANLLPPIQEGLQSFMGLLPMLKDQTGQFAKIVGEGIRDFLKGISTKEFGASLEQMFAAVQPILKNMMKFALPLARVFVAITKAATPMTDLIVGKLLGGLNKMAAWMETAKGQKTMLDFFNKAAYFAGLWWNVLKPLATTLGAVVKAATPLAEWMLKEIAGWLDRLSTKANSLSGQNAMKKYFEDQKKPIVETVRLIRDFIALFFDPKIGNAGLVKTLQALREKFLPAVKELVITLSNSNFGPQFVTFLTGVTDALGLLLKANTPLGTMLDLTGRFLSMIASHPAIGGAGITALTSLFLAMKGVNLVKAGLDKVKSLFGFGGGKDRGSSISNPLYVWSVNGGGGGVPPAGVPGKVAKVLKVAKTVAKKAVIPVVAATVAFKAADFVSDRLEKHGAKDGNRSTTDRLGKSAATVGKYAGAGAAFGAAGGPVGAAVGAVIGTAVGSAKSIFDWYWGSNKSQEKDSKDKARKIAAAQHRAYQDRLNSLLPPSAFKAGRLVNDNLSLGMLSTKKKLYAASGEMAKIPDDSFKFNRPKYRAAGRNTGADITAGLGEKKPFFTIRAQEWASELEKKIKANKERNRLAGLGAGTAITTGLANAKKSYGTKVTQFADEPRRIFTATNFSPLGVRIGNGIATGLVKSYAGISAAMDALFLKLTRQSGDAAIATEKEIMRRTRNAVGDGPGAPVAVEGPTPTAGGSGGSARSMAKTAIAITGGRVTSGYRSPAANRAAGGSPNSYHLDEQNPAQDIVSPNMSRTFDFLYGQYGKNIREMIYGNKMVKMGKLMPYTRNDHWDHVHVAHNGGDVKSSWPTMPGLKTDERPAILQVGERVVSKSENNGGGLTDSQLETMLRRVMENAKAPVHVEQTFNERVDPMLVSSELAWRLT